MTPSPENDVLVVLSQLRDLEEFMRRHAVTAWPEEVRQIQIDGRNDRQELKRRVLDMYRGTMGSLRDLIISRVNGHRVNNEKEANTELDRRIDELWERATAL